MIDDDECGAVGGKICRSEAIPVKGSEDLYGCETSRIPHCPDDRRIDGGCQTYAPAAFYPQKYLLVLISVRG
jgi:hypothetical protein